MDGPSILLEELANAADSHLIRKQLFVLFHRETLEAEQAVVELERNLAHATEKIRKKQGYISEFEGVGGTEAANAVTYLKEMVFSEEEQVDRLHIMLVAAQRAARQSRRYMAKFQGDGAV